MGTKYLTIKKAAELIGISPNTLRAWDKNGKLKAERMPGNNYRGYKITDILNFIEENGIKDAPKRNILDE